MSFEMSCRNITVTSVIGAWHFRVTSIYDIEIPRSGRVDFGSVELAALVTSPRTRIRSRCLLKAGHETRQASKMSVRVPPWVRCNTYTFYLKLLCTCKCSAVQAVRIEHPPRAGVKTFPPLFSCLRFDEKFLHGHVGPVLNRRRRGLKKRQ